VSRTPATNPELRPGLLQAGALALVLLVGFGVRAAATLGPDCIAGDDGAYYFVQVRGLLRGAGLPFPDFPLLFQALATAARFLSWFMAPGEAVVAAVRWADTLLPLLLVLPVHLLAKDLGGGRPERTALATLLVGLLALLSGNVLGMAGGMIKNAAALPFSLLYVHHLDRSLRDRALRPALLAALWFLVSSLMHVSALVLNVAFTAILVLAGLGRRAGGGSLARTLGGFALAGLALALVPGLDADRGARLLGTLARPWTAFTADPTPALAGFPFWLGHALGVLGLVVLRVQRRTLDDLGRTQLWAASLTALALSCPFLRPDLHERLALVAFVPGLVPAVHLACRVPAGRVLLLPVLACALLHGYLAVKTLRLTGFTRPALADLVRMREALPPGRNLVLVREGLDWWAAWILDTHISTRAGRGLADRDSYAAVLLLEEVRPGAFGRAPAAPAVEPGDTLRDGGLLRSEALSTLQEGVFFRLSRVEAPGRRTAGHPEPHRTP